MLTIPSLLFNVIKSVCCESIMVKGASIMVKLWLEVLYTKLTVTLRLSNRSNLMMVQI